ncbi:hypothetical protein [Paracoccus tegillarcae]|uniref:Lipoprotein n=1 Tax=Paracoccus tegillarcae TaxID=1529068 RepID=A0A2K9EPG3_9RHOB|nr:hypothetical protein [Paracoccus tegillarcae]AUH32596.1 hypothetical protein CUV01_03665 [Paracoccus tegillarcae]
MKAAISILGMTLALAACDAPTSSGNTPATASTIRVAANEMQVDTLAGGAFQGRAGSAWTEAEIATQVASLECSGRKPATITVAPAQGGFSFSGRC